MTAIFPNLNIIPKSLEMLNVCLCTKHEIKYNDYYAQ